MIVAKDLMPKIAAPSIEYGVSRLLDIQNKTQTMESNDGRKSKPEAVVVKIKKEEQQQQQQDPKTQGASQTSTVSLEEDYHNLEASQVTLSQADEVIQKLDKEGELTEVAGSQSMLSQELLCMSQRESDDDEYAHRPSNLVPCSQQTETSISMAQRLGLLTQDTLEGDDPASMGQSSPLSQTDAKNSIGVEAPMQRSLVAVALENNASPSDQGFQLASQQEGEDQEEEMEDVPLSQDPIIKANLKEPLLPKIIIPTKKIFGDVLGTPTPKSTMFPPIRDTPVRTSECFGSLLDAVQVITEQEEVDAKLYALQHAASPDSSSTHNPQEASTGNKRQSPTTSSDQPIKKKRTTTASSKKKETENKAQQAAKRAAALAEQTVADPEMAKKLLLSMALVRENPRMAPSSWPPKGAVVPEGFFWAHYPPLEGVLKKHMAEYYELSTTKCQSAQQQAFNNDLVVLIREAARKQGWTFDTCFSDKILRDRIRCYFKTHIQNAKKRLRTMVRNPTKRANARHLCAHLDLIEKHKYTEGDEDDDDKPDAKAAASAVKKEVKARRSQEDGANHDNKDAPVKKEVKPRRSQTDEADLDKKDVTIKQEADSRRSQTNVNVTAIEV